MSTAINLHIEACRAHDEGCIDCLRSVDEPGLRTLAKQRVVSDAGFAALLVELACAWELDGVAVTPDGLRVRGPQGH